MFSKNPPADPRPLASASAMAAGSRNGGSTFSVFGADIAIKGDVHALADLHLDGRIEGDIECGALVQGEGGEVIGAIHAQTARLAGTVRGSIEAGELVILKSARIHGDVTYDALTIEHGATVEGRFAHRVVVAAPALAEEDETARISLVG